MKQTFKNKYEQKIGVRNEENMLPLTMITNENNAEWASLEYLSYMQYNLLWFFQKSPYKFGVPLTYFYIQALYFVEANIAYALQHKQCLLKDRIHKRYKLMWLFLNWSYCTCIEFSLPTEECWTDIWEFVTKSNIECTTEEWYKKCCSYSPYLIY